ncbi:metallophosphoesterase [Methylotenera sp. N17]|uniref:metallophosphoesterase n=1 Tax=Methylotenera sp. N17 TaxID=1502761 RepID=UPI0009DF53B5|nr:metallophosphoesterase [Methylotenera sp. N17]
MKQLFNRLSALLSKRWVISILLVVLSIGAIGLHRYFHPNIYRIPSNPDNAQEINFFALGDQGSGSLEQRAVADAMEKVARKNKNLDFVVLLGDNFYIDKKLTESSDEWNTMFEEVYSGAYLSAVPFYAILGNHDKDLSFSEATHPEIEYSKKALGSNRWRMPAHYFHSDFGNINGRPLLRIVFIDTNASANEMAIQANYVREQFINNPVQPIWKIVAGHHTIRTCGKHLEDKANLIKTLLPVLQEAKVDIYLSGHDHNQQLIVKDNEPTYVINGAGGKSLYAQKIHSDDLRFFNEAYGFVSLKINPTTLNINFYNKSAKNVSSHVLSRACDRLKSDCLKAVN